MNPMMGFRIRPDKKERIQRIAARDKTTVTDVINQLIDMAIDKREAWSPPQVELPKPPKL